MLFELAERENDAPTREEAERELAALRSEIDQLEVRTLLSGEYDAREALISINAQAGGADAADFAENLLRMYLRWAERHKFPTEVYDTSYAEEAGIRSTTFAVNAPYAYGTLRGEHGNDPDGPRISKYDNQGRQTSFAGVDAMPVVEDGKSGARPRTRSGRTCSARRGRAARGSTRPTRRSASPTCPPGSWSPARTSAARSRTGPRRWPCSRPSCSSRRRQEEAEQMAALRGDGARAWGSQIRNYVLYPYQNVKDVRTGMETGNAVAVLDGEIDDFIDAEIRWLRQNGR